MLLLLHNKAAKQEKQIHLFIYFWVDTDSSVWFVLTFKLFVTTFKMLAAGSVMRSARPRGSVDSRSARVACGLLDYCDSRHRNSHFGRVGVRGKGRQSCRVLLGLPYTPGRRLSSSSSTPPSKPPSSNVPALPPSPPSLTSTVLTKSGEMGVMLAHGLKDFVLSLPSLVWYYVRNPREVVLSMARLRDYAKQEAKHYYMGSKLLLAEVRTAKKLLMRTLSGSPLTRRERKQLVRTTSDLFRLVPMSVFVLIPFMEFLLPFALKVFPNMLPSTFQDTLKAEENMKRELKSRIAMAGFFQETLKELAKEKAKLAKARIKREEGKEELDQGGCRRANATTRPSGGGNWL